MSVTVFQQKVYNALKQIPKGKVTTYKILASYLNCGSAQAIGQALKKNPFAPEVPCHRVIKTDFHIGGYIGEMAGSKIEKKKKLLEKEGVTFDVSNKLHDKSVIHKF